MSPKYFSVACIALVCTALVSVAALNLATDPYAQYGTQLVHPVVQESRLEKIRLLDACDEPPLGLVFGSSRVHKFEPDYLAEHLGIPFFNLGVNHGKPEDFLALLRHYRSRFHQTPRIAIVGIDPISLSESEPTDARLLGSDLLSSQIIEFLTVEDQLQRWSDLISWNQTRYSLVSLKNLVLPSKTVAEESFRSDGLIQYHQREKEIAEGSYDFQSALQYNQQEYEALYRRAAELSGRRCACIEKFIEECQQSDCQVVLFLPPQHPQLARHLSEAITPHDSNHSYRVRALEFIHAMASRKKVPLFDFTEIESFNGQADLFVDGVHPLEPNTRRMINAMTHSLTVEHKYALQ
ncbi:MAG: hypothetical protein AB8B50_17440 [Pirellulaceae bacterium]